MTIDNVLPTIDTSVIADGATAQTLQQFSADLQSYLGDLQQQVTSLANPAPALAFSQWQDVPYAAQNFGAAVGTNPTWTVNPSNILGNRYLVVGKILFWHVSITSGAITGAPVVLTLQAPAGLPLKGFGSAAIQAEQSGIQISASANWQPSVIGLVQPAGATWSGNASVLLSAVLELM